MAVLVVGLGLTFQLTIGSNAGASPTTAFEIDDANIAEGGAAALDWDSLFGRVPAGGATAPVVAKNPSGFLATGFAEDPMSSDDLPVPPCDPGKKGDLTTLVAGGSDKNGDAINTWEYESNSVPDSKDDITNTYAAAKEDGGHKIFYFGFDRSNTNGSSHFDFEFVKAPMGLNPTGEDSSGCPKGNVTGSRTVGDILVSMNFTNGGTVGLEDIRLWDGDSYESQTNLTGKAGLFNNENGPVACGDWRCRDSAGGTITQLPANGMLEGYVDATALGVSGCFSSFNVKSRTSHSWSSELKDFVIGNFNTCDANISITPNGVNEVGDTHTFTGHVNVNPDGPFVNAPAGTIISFAKVSGPGKFLVGQNESDTAQCATIGTTGSCTVNLKSTTSGTTIVSASTTVAVGPLTLTRTTNGQAGNSGPATKHWADAYIKITPDDVNPVNAPHTFTAEFGVLPGGGSVSDVAIATSVTPTPSTPPGPCEAEPVAGKTNVWSCDITINSSSTGVFTANATGTAKVTKAGIADVVNLTRSTNPNDAYPAGPGGSTGPATKTYVDARIKVAPDGLNEVDDDHLVTATVETKDGNGAWTAASGVTVDFVLTGTGVFTNNNDDDCVTGGAGTCTVTIDSKTVGTSVVSATATPTVHGVSIKRSTDATIAPNGPGGTDNLTKRWADASIKVEETAINEVNDKHTFTVTVEAQRPTNETLDFSAVTLSVAPSTPILDSTCAAPTVNGEVATCTFAINSAVADIFDVDAEATITFNDGKGDELVLSRSTKGNAGPNGNDGATKRFVDARVSVGPDGTNKIGDDHTVIGKAEFNDGTGWKAAKGETITFDITQGVGQFVGDDFCVAGDDGTCSVAIDSDEAGVTWVSASTSYDVPDGVPGAPTLNRTTAAGGATDPANLRKEWVGAVIEITPTEVNPVGKAHVFDVKVTADSSGADIDFGEVTTSVTPAPDSKSDTCSPADRKVVDNVLTCTLTINSATAGVFTANAAAKVTFTGDDVVDFDISTNGQGGNSGPAVKTYVDARISVFPDGVNKVGDDHTVNALLEVNDGTGWKNAADDETIELAVLSGPGTLSAPSCETDGGTGSCSVVLDSDSVGTTVVSASATVNVLGEPLTRSTNSNAGPGGSDNLIKHWVNAAISITPNGLNPVGEPHTFDIKVIANSAGQDVTFGEVTTSVTPAPGDKSDTCSPDDRTVVGDELTCTITINSATAGVFTANATAKLTIGSGDNAVPFVLTTNGQGGNSGPAVKTYVDAYVKITPDDVNPVNEAHTFTAEFGVLAAGGDVSEVTITPSVTPTPSTPPGACVAAPVAGKTNVWSCDITINSSSTGVFTANATGTAKVTKAGTTDVVTLTRSTNPNDAHPSGPGGSGPAVKTYVDARIKVAPDGLNEVDDDHLVTATVETKDGNGEWTAADGVTVDFALTGTGGFVADDDDCVTGNAGTCSVSIDSKVVGTSVVSATATPTVHGRAVKRSTDATIAPNGPGGSGNLTKRWADASIRVVESAINEVNDAHTFTVTATAHKPTNEKVTFSAITPSVVPGIAIVAGSPSCAAPVVNDDVATCKFTINSAEAGIFDVDAAVTVTFNDGEGDELSITRSTTGNAGPNGNQGATKRFVDARVSVGPDGLNRVGDDHTVTGKAEFNDGTGWKAAKGETITFAITQGVGQFVDDDNTCVAGDDGTCSVAIDSATAGVTWVSASTSYDVPDGVPGAPVLSRTTNAAGPTNPANLRKEWVNAVIEITPTAVNPVGQAHVFNVKVTAQSSGADVDFGDVTTSVTPAPGTKSDTCSPAERTVEGNVLTCKLTINSNSAGVFTANAAARVTFTGDDEVVIDLTTNGQGGNSGPAVKTYVDADIQVGPDGVNAVGDPHTVAGHVNVNDGTGKENAPSGTFITFKVESGPGALSATSCATVGTTGSCSVTLTSSVAGVTVVSAETSVSVKGVVLDRTTNGQGANSDNLTKRWIDAFITISPDGVNPLNQPHTFTVTVTPITSGAAPVAFESITVAVTPAPSSQSDTCATPNISGGVATCTVTINSSSPGVFLANATAVVNVGGAKVTRSTDATVAPAGPGGSGPATKTYVPPAEVQGVQFLPRTGAFIMNNLRAAALLMFLGVLGFGYGLFGIQKRRRSA